MCRVYRPAACLGWPATMAAFVLAGWLAGEQVGKRASGHFYMPLSGGPATQQSVRTICAESLQGPGWTGKPSAPGRATALLREGETGETGRGVGCIRLLLLMLLLLSPPPPPTATATTLRRRRQRAAAAAAAANAAVPCGVLQKPDTPRRMLGCRGCDETRPPTWFGVVGACDSPDLFSRANRRPGTPSPRCSRTCPSSPTLSRPSLPCSSTSPRPHLARPLRLQDKLIALREPSAQPQPTHP